MTDVRSAVRRQLALEEEGMSLGIARYHSRALPWKDAAGAAGEEANLPPGQQLMKVAIEPVVARIEEFISETTSGKAGRRHAAAPFLLAGDPMELAYLTLRCVVNACTGEETLQSVGLKVAKAIHSHLAYSLFKELNRTGYDGLLRAQKKRGHSRQREAAIRKLFDAEGIPTEQPVTEMAAAGVKLVEMAVESTGLFILDRRPRKGGFAYILRPSETLMGWLDRQHARCALLTPVDMPMVVRPRRWRSPFYGGYLQRRATVRLVKQRNAYYPDELRAHDIERVYTALNHIQETPWKINRRVLDVVEQLLASGGDVAGLPPVNDEPIPPKPWDIDENEEARKAWKAAAASTHARNGAMISSRLAAHQRIWIARKFADEARIYFPHNLDFRGRVYPIPVTGPHPQGDDIAKGLLQFADGKRLGSDGKRWLSIHLANLFGVDKVPFEDRVAWTYENAERIIDSALDPVDGERFWMTADSPFMALAACIEWAESLLEGEDYVSFLPIALDGSNSGLQHFSAMLRDPVGARAVNLAPAEKPQDVYKEVATRAQAVADATPTISYEVRRGETVETVTVENPWRDGKITRSIAKRPTMTFCYSSTRFGMQGMVAQTLREMDRDNERRCLPPHLGGADNYQASVWLSHVLYDAIGNTVQAAARAMDWLRSAAQVASSANLPIWWTTPMGLPILQEYREAHGTRVKVHWEGQRVELVVMQDGTKLSKRSQMNGVAPNFIHSLDASHLMAVAEAAKKEGVNHLAVIHDSFGAHAADSGRLARLLRETFVAQYTPDVLKGFYEELKQQLPEDLAEALPKPPGFGDFCLSDVLQSDYVFA